MKKIKFTHYNHNPYGDKLNSSTYSLIDGEEYLVEFGEWEGATGALIKVRGFRISGVFMVNPKWRMINEDGTETEIPGIKAQNSMWFNNKQGDKDYERLLEDIKESIIEWRPVR
jgi:hypothetical protein